MSNDDKSELKIRRRNLSEYRQDHANPNKGTERGYRMIDDSLKENGAGRSIVAAADDSLVAGNKTWENAIDAGFTEAIEIETDGTQLVVVKRRDWSSVDDVHARTYAIRDNRAGELSLFWDIEQLLADQAAGHDLSRFFSDEEIAMLLQESAVEEFSLDHIPDLGRPVSQDSPPEAQNAPRKAIAYFPLAIVLDAANLRRWQAVKDRVGYKDDTRALLAVLDHLEGESNA